MVRRIARSSAALGCALLVTGVASGEEEPAPTQEPLSQASQGTTSPATKANVTFGGYVEAFYQWNLNKPANRITAYRAFDNRHDTITLSNAVLDTSWTAGRVLGRLALQIGHTGATYYAAEPTSPGGGAASPSDGSLWRFLQQASVGWRAPLGRGLLIEAGLFLSPVGPEGMAIKDQWNWSRSNLFAGLPFYHAGARATYPFTERLSATAAVYNGWNSVVDGNDEKSFSGQVTYAIPDRVTLQALYLGGVERPDHAPEGRAFRHLFDVYAAVYPIPSLGLLAHGDAGFERTTFGVSSWAAAALYARFQVASFLYVGARGDRFHEKVARSDAGVAAPIFWGGSKWVSSGTVTLDVRPEDTLSVRLELRHDQSESPLFFHGAVVGDGSPGSPFRPSVTYQNTITLGATAWF